MNCLACFNRDEDSDDSSPSKKEQPPPAETPSQPSNAQTFTFRELAMATKNFRQECLVGEGGFGRVFRGNLQASGQVVAVKQLDRNGMQGNNEFTVEITALSVLDHPNLVKLKGYCADGDQRLLVYEYMSMGSLEQHLFGDDPEKKPLDWAARMKIASGAAQGLEYLHEKANPPVIYGDFKSSNVLLNEDFEPKLSDVGLSKLGIGDGKNHSSSRVMGTYGYSAPEYCRGEEVTIKSDVYGFGVVLLELITGRRAIDTTRPTNEQNLVTWAQPVFRDPKRYSEMADPRLHKKFPATSLNQAVAIAAMCIQDEPMVRPLISDITSVLSCISMIPSDSAPEPYTPPQQQKMEHENEIQQNTPTHQDKDGSKCHSASSSDSEDTESRGASDQESGDDDSDTESFEHTQSSQLSDGESGPDLDSVDESDDESTYLSDEGSSANTDTTISSRQESGRKSSTERASSRTSSRKKNGASRKIVVTFKEPSPSSRYSAGVKSKTKEESLSLGDKSSCESEDEGGSAHRQENGSKGHAGNGLS